MENDCSETLNHEEALELAHIKRKESNLARCYIELVSRSAMPGWEPIETCPPEKEVWGFCAYEPCNTEGVGQPDKFPFVCMLVPADGEYDTHWIIYDAYGDILQDDGHPPTHWQPISPLPTPPKPEER